MTLVFFIGSLFSLALKKVYFVQFILAKVIEVKDCEGGGNLSCLLLLALKIEKAAVGAVVPKETLLKCIHHELPFITQFT